MNWIRGILWLVTCGYWVLMFTLTHLPPGEVRPPASLTDKHLHFLAYGTLTFMIGVTLMLWLPGRRWIPLYVLALAMAYGVFDERTQIFFNRTCELADWIADTAGAATAAVILALIQRKLPRPTPPDSAPEAVGRSAALKGPRKNNLYNF